MAAPTIAAPAVPGPVSCRIGTFLANVHDINNSERTFEADFWLWSVCPDADIQPLKTMEFPNAVSTTASLDATLQRGNVWWSTRKIEGKFRQDFQLQNYPFDEEPLVIKMEEGVLDSRGLVYSADAANSSVDPSIDLEGWRLRDFKLSNDIVVHPTTYGDPSLPHGHSDYATLTLRVTAERSHWLNLIKATLPLYIAAFFVLVMLEFDVIDDNLFLARVGVLSTTVFVVALSYLSVDAVVGEHQGIYMLDELHLAALGLILASTGWTAYAHIVLARRMPIEAVRARDAIICRTLQVGYLAANLVSIGVAMVRGTV